jgi:hypothetical protein
MLWCWRCRADMPMLDEPEFEKIKSLFWSAPLATRAERIRAEYERLTGVKESNMNAIFSPPPFGLRRTLSTLC